MDKRAEKDISKLANFILNNITISEALHILAKKSQEVAEDMIKNNINHLEYKQALLKDKEIKTPDSLLDKTFLWFKNLINKNKKEEVVTKQKKEEPLKDNSETTTQNASKQTMKTRPSGRTSFSTKKNKK